MHRILQLWSLSVCRGKRLEQVLLYICGKDFVAQNPGWSPIWEIVTTAGAYSQSVDATECIYRNRATPSHI